MCDGTIRTAENLFNEFNNVMLKFQIPFQNIVGFSSDNANTMTGSKCSFTTLLKQYCPNLILN